MGTCIKNGNKMKDVGLIIKMPTEQCSNKERDYIRVRYIAKLIQWKQSEIDENIKRY